MNFPVDFEIKARQPRQATGGYPSQISSADLMANFEFAALDARPSVNGTPQPFSITKESAGGNKTSRILTFNPAPPLDDKTYVLGFSGGRFQWLPTEKC